MGIGWQNVSEEREMRRLQMIAQVKEPFTEGPTEFAEFVADEREWNELGKINAREERKLTTPGYVYRCFAGSFEDSELLYVGMSKSAAERCLTHLDKEWGD